MNYQFGPDPEDFPLAKEILEWAENDNQFGEEEPIEPEQVRE
jgi:hypothetical protein